MNVTQGLRRVLQTNPEGIATIDGDRRRSWREIGERVARLAGGLQGLGVKRGDRVAVLMLSSDRYLELYLGIAWAGAVIVPTNIRWSHAERSEEHTSELQSRENLVCRLLLEKKKTKKI